ncbi:MAG: tetratricopeptide repeat protein [Cryomorphaceae bacterium]
MKRMFAGIFLILIVITACQENNTAKLDTGNELRIVDPFDSINTLIKQSPNNPDLYFQRARMHYDQRDLETSMNDVGRALKLDSNNTDYYMLLADLKLIAKESRASRDALLKAYAIAPNDIDVLLRLGELYMIVRDADESFKYLNEALRLDVYNATAYRLKGFNYKYMADTANAVSSFQTAVEQDPQDYDSYLQLGLLYSSVGNELAEDYYNNALKVRPQSVEALYAKGLFLQTVNRSRNAIETYDEILSIAGSYFDAWYNKGYVYMVQLEKYDSASYCFSRAIEFGPTNYVEAYYNRGLAFEQAGNLEKSKENYRAALKINPQYDLAALGLGRLEEGK